eukprot:1161600-Pelagomonas_calceolata.AAC.3
MDVSKPMTKEQPLMPLQSWAGAILLLFTHIALRCNFQLSCCLAGSPVFFWPGLVTGLSVSAQLPL